MSEKNTNPRRDFLQKLSLGGLSLGTMSMSPIE
ncbi:MAG: twin-arginine translocation signal domain-containing protein [Saprospiraceae bacterium]|nr:twin-arginine translocation signal domain-containing protein [Saprospiraceae bacterium]